MATNRSAMTALVFLIASATHNWQSAQAGEKATPPPPPGLSTHVLNTATGKPASGITIILQRQKNDGWEELRRGETDTQGRVKELQPAGKKLPAGTYRLVFETGDYFKGQGTTTFFPRVDIIFSTENPDEHYHVPLLLSPFGYSTYRGS
jgi:5-hydroxyisourate hydrolase